MPNINPSLHHRLRKAKAALLVVSFTLAGILLMMLNAWLTPLQLGDWQWLHALPLGELGGTLFGAGLLSAFFEYTFRRDQERAVTERFRQTIRDEAPALRDAVIEAFRFDRQDVARIATPELLDDLARTSLGLRFGDPAFGREVYTDIRHQAMAAEERWYDARVDATLGIPRGRSSAPTPFFDLRVRWEYTVTPRHRFRKFAVVSDRQRYDQLVAERGETSVWYRRPVPGLTVSDPEVFALEQFTVNGTPVLFTRQFDEVSQVYTVDLGEQVIQQEQAVVISFSFRTRTLRSGHVVHLDIDRPHAVLTSSCATTQSKSARCASSTSPPSVKEDASPKCQTRRRCATATMAGSSRELAWSSSGRCQTSRTTGLRLLPTPMPEHHVQPVVLRTPSRQYRPRKTTPAKLAQPDGHRPAAM